VFTRANLERAFGGVLRHFVLGDSADPGAGRGPGMVIYDDERPFILYADPPAEAVLDSRGSLPEPSPERA
jgi:manganese/iron transport system ATP-binding protein